VPRFRCHLSILVAFALVFGGFGAVLAIDPCAIAAATGAPVEPRWVNSWLDTGASESGEIAHATQSQAATAAQQPPTAASAGSGPCTLRAAVADIPPYATVDAAGHWSGDAVDLFRTVAQDMGCEVEFVSLSPSEIMRALEREEIDAVALPFTASPLSASLLSLSPSFATSRVTIAVFRDNFSGDLEVLYKSLATPRQLRVYAAMLALVILFAVLIWALEKTKNQHFRGKRHEGIGSGLWWSITTLSTVGYGDKVPVSGVGRFFAGTWMILSLVLVAIFTATITSSITAHDSSIEVTGAHDLPRARVGVMENGIASGYVNEHFLPHVSYPTLALAMEELRLGNLDAVLADQHSLERALSELNESRIKILEKPVSRSPVSFGLRKTLSRDMIRRFDAALIARLERGTAPTPATSTEPQKEVPNEAPKTP
jgi:ABC-type amino acid transport substrate-binding protein